MLPYSRGLILDNANNYGILKTEAVFGFGPFNNSNYVNDNINSSKPLEWIFATEGFQRRSMQGEPETQLESETRAMKDKPTQKTVTVNIHVTEKPVLKTAAKLKELSKKVKKPAKSKRKSTRHGKGKGFNKCILKIMKGGGEDGGSEGSVQNEVPNILRRMSLAKKRKRRKGMASGFKMPHKRVMMPVILGLLAAKSLLIPIALKALAFMSAKGLMMGFFSTVMASVLSLKGMFNNHNYQNRKDEAKTQVEIIQVPTKSEDHVYYDDHYRRGDYIQDDPYRREMYDEYRRGDVIPVIPVNMQNFKRNGAVPNVKT